MTIENIERYLVEIWRGDDQSQEFAGNGIIATQDGKRKVFTAAHVACRTAGSSGVEVRGDEATLGKKRLRLSFTPWHESEVAEADLGAGDGVTVTDQANLGKILRIRGSIQGEDHAIEVKATYVNGKRVEEMIENQILDGEIIHYNVVGGNAYIIPGTSGSVILNFDDEAVGINTYRMNSKGTQGRGWLLSRNKE